MKKTKRMQRIVCLALAVLLFGGLFATACNFIGMGSHDDHDHDHPEDETPATSEQKQEEQKPEPEPEQVERLPEQADI